MRRSILLSVVFACSYVSAARAQGIVFADIAWGMQADSVRARVEAQGFALDSVLADGDQVYRRADGSWLKAYLRAARAIGITVIDPARRPAVDARFHALADSLAARLGPPAHADAEEVRWEAGLAQVSVEIEFARGPQVEVRWVGPGWYDEMHRRKRLLDLPPLPPGYTIVSATPISYVSVDTGFTARKAAGVLRGRFRVDYAQAVGDSADRYDAARYEMEFDCAGRRTRLLRRTTFLAGERRRDDVYQRIPWAPPQPGNHYDRGLSAVCRAARR
ncbi:MAG TPA: surface-adhesin E family protein [Longimicrobium sp.]|jgi:hypothetical protein|nr:surface-adhesin E family protein [Longimicrobium sp.]